MKNTKHEGVCEIDERSEDYVEFGKMGTMLPSGTIPSPTTVVIYDDSGAGFMVKESKNIMPAAREEMPEEEPRSGRKKKGQIRREPAPQPRKSEKVFFQGLFGRIAMPVSEVIETDSAVILVSEGAEMNYTPPDNEDGYEMTWGPRKYHVWNMNIAYQFGGSHFLVLLSERKD